MCIGERLRPPPPLNPPAFCAGWQASAKLCRNAQAAVSIPIAAARNVTQECHSSAAIALMKKYKLESLIYYSKLFADKEHIIEASSTDIQKKLDEFARQGWRLVSTDATDFGIAVYFYLYFEKDA